MNAKSSKTFSPLLLLLILISTSLVAQQNNLTLKTCQELAMKNYPLVSNLELVKLSGDYSVSNVKSAYLPQISVNGQYTIQSDVTQLPLKLPNIIIPEISKNQYKAYAEVTQLVYDGGTVKNQKENVIAQSKIEEENLNVELYKIKERINQLYFGILLLKSQANQVELTKGDIKAGLDKIQAAFKNGTALKSNVDALQVELLKTDQRLIELNAAMESYKNMLGLFINRPLTDTTELEMPIEINPDKDINRPEKDLFAARINSTAIQLKTINSKNLPKVNLFFQGGYGLPALNMLDPDANLYYIAGVRFIYPLSGFYNKHREKSIVDLSRRNIEYQYETFLLNTKLQMTQQEVELNKNQKLIESDNEIIELRLSIKKASLSQLENGVITASDYIREVNNTDNALQAQIIHRIQMLLAEYNYQLITGN
ncbi:MAG: TolC family protein [Omnitrophica WOR_2 bacterium]